MSPSLLLVVPLLCQAAPPQGARDAGAADGSIKEVVSGVRAALEAGDEAKLSGLLWPDATVFSGGVNFKGLLDRKLRWISEDNTGRAEGTLAYVAQRAVVEEAGSDGGTRGLVVGVTFVLRQKEGRWRVQHLHWTEVPTASAPRRAPAPWRRPPVSRSHRSASSSALLLRIPRRCSSSVHKAATSAAADEELKGGHHQRCHEARPCLPSRW